MSQEIRNTSIQNGNFNENIKGDYKQTSVTIKNNGEKHDDVQIEQKVATISQSHKGNGDNIAGSKKTVNQTVVTQSGNFGIGVMGKGARIDKGAKIAGVVNEQRVSQTVKTKNGTTDINQETRNINITGGIINASGAGAFSLGDLHGTVVNKINQVSTTQVSNLQAAKKSSGQSETEKILVALKEMKTIFEKYIKDCDLDSKVSVAITAGAITQDILGLLNNDLIQEIILEDVKTIIQFLNLALGDKYFSLIKEVMVQLGESFAHDSL